MRIQATSLCNFTRTVRGLKATVTLPNGFKMETTTWDSKRLVLDEAVTICKVNKAFGRLIVSPGQRQQEVIKI
jgi:hypothetical protein